MDDGGIPFAKYEDTDGMRKLYILRLKITTYFVCQGSSLGKGTGKTTFAQNFALEAFNKGYGVFAVDAADGRWYNVFWTG